MQVWDSEDKLVYFPERFAQDGPGIRCQADYLPGLVIHEVRRETVQNGTIAGPATPHRDEKFRDIDRRDIMLQKESEQQLIIR